jgi:hypothetical protein
VPPASGRRAALSLLSVICCMRPPMCPSCGLVGKYTVTARLLEGVELQGKMLIIGRDAGIADGQLPAASSCSVVEGLVWRCDNPLKSRWPIIQVGFVRAQDSTSSAVTSVIGRRSACAAWKTACFAWG